MSDLQSPANFPQQNALGADPNFLRYLQGFIANPVNAGKIQGKKISTMPAKDGQVLVYQKASNTWFPVTISSGVSGTITIPKITTSTGSITVSNGIITGFTNPT